MFQVEDQKLYRRDISDQLKTIELRNLRNFSNTPRMPVIKTPSN